MPKRCIRVLLALESSSNDVLLDKSSCVNSFSLGNTEKLPDTRSPLWTKSLGHNCIGKPGDLLLALLGNDAGEHADVRTNNAASNRSSLSLTFSGCSIALGSRGEEESDPTIGEDTLLHGKTIVVIATGDLENISFELFSKIIGFNFLSHSLFEEMSPAIGIVDHHCLGGSVFRVRQTELRYFVDLPSLIITN